MSLRGARYQTPTDLPRQQRPSAWVWHEQGSGPARVHALDALVVSLTDVERAWLRALCGFLNTGEGGRVYMGVLDSGVVVGLEMTSSLLQHLQQGTHDMMSRYSPPVSRERYTVREPSYSAYCTHSALLGGLCVAFWSVWCCPCSWGLSLSLPGHALSRKGCSSIGRWLQGVPSFTLECEGAVVHAKRTPPLPPQGECSIEGV